MSFNILKGQQQAGERRGVFRNSYYLLAESFNLLQKNKRVFILSSLIVGFFALFLFGASFSFFSIANNPDETHVQAATDPRFLAILFFSFFLFIFLATLLRASIATLIHSHIENKKTSLMESIKDSLIKTDHVFCWTLISTIAVSVFVFAFIRLNTWILLGVLAISYLLWIVFTFTMIPLLTLENNCFLPLIGRSFFSSKKRWPEILVMTFSFNIFVVGFSVITLTTLAFIAIFIVKTPFIFALLLLAMLVIVFILSFSISMHTIFRTVLYRYSLQG